MTTLLGTYQSLRIKEARGILTIQLYRPEANNSLNAGLLEEMMSILQQVETDREVKVIVLEGMPGYFCNGMDFRAISDGGEDALMGENPDGYYELLKHLVSCSKVVIAKVEGKVNAGGIGLVAACDMVIADEKASFSLSEALFGLLPACVLPFLVRRVGVQKAQWMSLSTQQISAERAYQIGLVDELTTNVNISLRKYQARLSKLDTTTIADLKVYIEQLWIIDQKTQELAVNKITSLLNTEKVQSNIKNFVQKGKFPWEK